MTYAVVFASQTGNTRRVAEAIRDALPADSCLSFGPPSSAAAGAELLLVGSWADKGDCAPEVAAFLEGLSGQRVALFGTAGFGGSDAYFDQLAARFAAHLPGGCRLTGHFFCQGKMPLSVRCRYEQLQAENPGDPKVEGMLANFDAALAHPSAADLAAAAAFAREQAER